MLADVNGDGRADIVGFANAGVLVALADGTGGFAAPRFVLGALGASVEAGGWASNTVFPRMLADVNGDGRADIVGFANAGALVALADGTGGFDAPQLAMAGFGAAPEAGGWVSNDLFPRLAADVTGDGRADIVGFSNSGVSVGAALTSIDPL
jgi:hypothetical protein